MTPTAVRAAELPFFTRSHCAQCGNRGGALVAYCPRCSEVTDEHYHRRCMKCGHGWAEQTTRQPKPLTVRLRGHDVELTCVCTFTVVQPLRAVIAEQYPRCRRRWRR
jgi:hypothetical protein